MNTQRFIVIAGCIIALATIATAFEEPYAARQDTRPTPGYSIAIEQSTGKPDYIVYRLLLHDVFISNRRAKELERAGDEHSAQAWRRRYQNEAALSDEQMSALNRVAAECERDLSELDARARSIIDARRALYYPGNKVRPGGAMAPPSVELQELQHERHMVVIRWRNRLSEDLGTVEFDRFTNYLRNQIAPRITLQKPDALPRAGQPTDGEQSSANRPVREKRNGVLQMASFITPVTFGRSLPASQSTNSTQIHGYTSASYDAATNLVTASATTELDYPTQEYYQAYTNATLTDDNGNVLSSANVVDTHRTGSATVEAQATGVRSAEYTMTGRHRARMSIQDPALGNRYTDVYNYYDFRLNNEGQAYPFYYVFFGPGPLKPRNFSTISLGNTFAQALPMVGLGMPTVSPSSISSTAVPTQTATLSIPVTASAVGIRDGDYAVIELNRTAGTEPLTYANGPDCQSGGTNPRTCAVNLNPGEAATANFRITAGVTSAGTHANTLQVRVIDVLRPPPSGSPPGTPPTSLLTSTPPRTQANTNGVTTTLTVTNP